MEIFVGTFTEEDLNNKKDKVAFEKSQKERNLKFIKNKIAKEKGQTVMKVWVSDKF